LAFLLSRTSFAFLCDLCANALVAAVRPLLVRMQNTDKQEGPHRAIPFYEIPFQPFSVSSLIFLRGLRVNASMAAGQAAAAMHA
jgi:hypothetical protein